MLQGGVESGHYQSSRLLQSSRPIKSSKLPSFRCLGLYDTVAATGGDPFRSLMGIPAKNEVGNSGEPPEKLSNFVRVVEDHIECTYQALAINERRSIFVRTGAVLGL